MSIYQVHQLPGHHLMRADELRALSLFDGLTDDQLRGAEPRAVPRFASSPEPICSREGEHADFWWVLIDGAIDLVRHIGREDTVVSEDGRAG